MFLKYKKYLIFMVLLLVLIVLAALKIFFPAQVEPVQLTLPQLSLETPQEAPTGVTYTFKEDLPNLPKSVPVYRIINPPTLSLPEANQIAQNFGFSAEPKINTDIESGDFYSWADNNQYLSIGGNPTKISYGVSSLTSVSTTSASLSNREAGAIAQKIFKEKFPLEKNIDFNKPSFSHSQTNSEFIKISYNYKLNGLSLLGNAPTVLPFSVSLGSGGEIISLDYLKYSESFEKGEEGNLLNKKQIETALSLQKGTIVHSLSDQDIDAEIPPVYQINSVEIKKINIAYYYPLVPVSAKEILIQPVFVFEGTGLDQKTGKIVSLIIYLPATPGL